MIDPNVWISALINPSGTPARVVELVMSGRVVAVVTQELLDELAAVLLRPKFRRWISAADAVAFVEALAGSAEVHPGSASTVQATRDPKDDYLAALADKAGARLVSGDADLLEAPLDPPAVTPRALLALLDT